MNTRGIPTSFFTSVPTVGNLFHTIGNVIHEWIRVRMHARALQKLDFRQLREDEIPNHVRTAIDVDRNAPDEDFENL